MMDCTTCDTTINIKRTEALNAEAIGWLDLAERALGRDDIGVAVIYVKFARLVLANADGKYRTNYTLAEVLGGGVA